MPLVIKKQEFEKATEGLHTVIITKVEDLGPIETQNGTKDFVRVVFTCEDQKDKEGKKVDVFQRFTKSLGVKSNLGKLLNQLGYSTLSAEFDLEDIVGTKAQIVVEHVEKDGNVYANVASVIKQRKQNPTEF